MSYPIFDRSRLHLKPLAERIHDMKLAEVLPLDAPAPAFDDPALPAIAERIVRARQIGAPVILLMGAHVIKVGLSRFVIDLMERGIITHVGMNGAGPIHDFELALIGATTESVARYIQEGQFGLWDETGWINDIVAEGVRDGLGYGEALGRAIQGTGIRDQGSGVRGQESRYRTLTLPRFHALPPCRHQHPRRGLPAARAGHRAHRGRAGHHPRAPELRRRGAGRGIVPRLPDLHPDGHPAPGRRHAELRHRGDGAGGVPQGALDGAQRRTPGRAPINQFTTAVFDLIDLGDDLSHEASKTDARYYYRPFKTILVRTVQDGGESFYVQGRSPGDADGAVSVGDCCEWEMSSRDT